jgi:hypothetical protein
MYSRALAIDPIHLSLTGILTMPTYADVCRRMPTYAEKGRSLEMYSRALAIDPIRLSLTSVVYEALSS